MRGGDQVKGRVRLPGVSPWRGLGAGPTACLPSAPLGEQSPGRGPRPGSAEWVLLLASGMVLMPRALQKAVGALGGAGS